MLATTSLVAQSAALISNVKSLENQNNLLKKQIEEAKINIENQKIEAEYISQLMKLEKLPDIETTSSKVNQLQEQISNAQKRQDSLHNESQSLQEQMRMLKRSSTIIICYSYDHFIKKVNGYNQS